MNKTTYLNAQLTGGKPCKLILGPDLLGVFEMCSEKKNYSTQISFADMHDQ